MRGKVALTTTLLVGLPVFAQEITLFNGRDLTGWNGFLDKKATSADHNLRVADVFQVKPGGILHVVGTPMGYLRTIKEYANYRLRLQWRWADTNPKALRLSGLFVRTSGADRLWPMSYEVEIADTDSLTSGDLWIIGYE